MYDIIMEVRGRGSSSPVPPRPSLAGQIQVIIIMSVRMLSCNNRQIGVGIHKPSRGGICQCRHCRRQCKIFASGVNFSIFTHFFVFLSLKLLKLGEIDGVKV